MQANTYTSDPSASIVTDLEANLQTYGDILLSTGRKASTVKTNGRYLSMAAKVMDRDPSDWSDATIEAFIQTPNFRNWAPQTQKTVKAILKSYWQVHHRDDLLLPNNYHFWKSRTAYSGGSNRHDDLKAKAVPQNDVQDVLEICGDVILHGKATSVFRHTALFFIAAYGLRRMEVANLRLCDIRMDTRTLHVEESKGDKSRDIYMDIELTPQMWDAIMVARSSIVSRLQAEAAESHVLTKLASLSDLAAPLFFYRETDRVGERMTPEAIGGLLLKVATRILGRAQHPHAFRHSKAFYLLEVKKIPLHNASQYLGHANVQQTMDYSYPDVDKQRDAFEGVQAAPVVAPAPAPAPAPSGSLDAAVDALTALLSQGTLSPEAYGRAIASLKGS